MSSKRDRWVVTGSKDGRVVCKREMVGCGDCNRTRSTISVGPSIDCAAVPKLNRIPRDRDPAARIERCRNIHLRGVSDYALAVDPNIP